MKKNLALLTLVAVVLLAVVFLAFHLQQQTEEEVLSQFNERQLLIARQTARQIESYFHSSSQDARYLSSLTSVQHFDVKTMRTDIQAYSKRLETVHIEGVSVLDEKGKIVYSNGADAIGSNHTRSDIYAWAKKPANKGMVRLVIEKTDQQGAPATGEGVKPSSPGIFLVTPVYQESVADGSPGPGGKFAGILLLTVDLEKMLAERTLLFEPTKKPRTLWIWMMDEDGTLLLQSEHPSMVMRNIREKKGECNRCHGSFDYAEKIATAKQGTVEYQLKGRQKKIAAFAPMTFEDTSWIVVVNSPFDEVTGFIRGNFRDTLWLIGIVVVAIGLAFFSMYRTYRQRVHIQEEVKHLKEKQGLMEALRESRDYLENLLKYANAPIIVWDPDFRVTRFNQAFERLTGRSAGEVLGRSLDILFPADRREEAMAHVLSTTTGERWEAVEISIVHVDGSVRTVLWNSATLYATDGTTAIATIAQGQDITARKQAEEAVRDAHQRLAFYMDRMPLAYIVWNLGFGVEEWNPAAERIFGWKARETIGKNAYELIIPKEARPQFEHGWSKLFKGDESSYSLNANVRKDGKIITCEWFNALLRDASGNVSGVLSMVHDVTERAELQKQVRTAQRMEAVGTLAGGIAHDFNNSLTGIVGFGELLRVRMAGDEQALHDLDEILHCAERAATLTRQLLTFARRQVIEPVNLNLSALVADLMKFIGKVVGEHIEVKTSLEKNIPTIFADRGQIEQVVMNLCLNARDAMPEGGRLVVETEDVSLEEEYVRQNPYMRTGRYALLTVSDTGVGMDEKTRERVFEPFFTTKGPDKGTGLGLAMVYGIVKQHGGYIHLYSEPGKGTAFKVYFPAIEAQPDAVPEKHREETVRGGTETILLAEDEEAIRALAERILTGFGYTVLAARNGEEAIGIFRQHKEIVLAVLDVVMPQKGGKEAFEEMHKQNPRLKVIFMSGYSANAIHDSFVLIPDMPFLQKPFGPTTLARKVREVLDTPI
ncbi:PAS domain S-box protein [Candidatus Deferrimicrobium sp.]|uniref:PAS domain S-box protein n=1 Tax=Candidatus Deferrimicrobium sp. TaxID=3060586 RepID=UPI0027176272|nr:PAS domain S-box protein [Candidatus Deferrimicrobium sp.]MDO8738720.1 PAS domain S-box protein [Candidatus Deferrimicrobium sp.]